MGFIWINTVRSMIDRITAHDFFSFSVFLIPNQLEVLWKRVSFIATEFLFLCSNDYLFVAYLFFLRYKVII